MRKDKVLSHIQLRYLVCPAKYVITDWRLYNVLTIHLFCCGCVLYTRRLLNFRSIIFCFCLIFVWSDFTRTMHSPEYVILILTAFGKSIYIYTVMPFCLSPSSTYSYVCLVVLRLFLFHSICLYVPIVLPFFFLSHFLSSSYPLDFSIKYRLECQIKFTQNSMWKVF